jgi:hypothetical protein
MAAVQLVAPSTGRFGKVRAPSGEVIPAKPLAAIVHEEIDTSIPIHSPTSCLHNCSHNVRCQTSIFSGLAPHFLVVCPPGMHSGGSQLLPVGVLSISTDCIEVVDR